MGKGEEGKTGWSVEGWNYEKEREQIVRATVGAGEIVVRKDVETGTDSTAGLNRDVSKAYEITKDKEERTELYASSSSIDAALKPGETLRQWSDGLLNYDKTALDNFNKAASALNVMVNRVDNILGRPMDARAAAVAGKDLAESTLEALILSGKNRRDAMAMMGDPDFIDGVLASVAALNGIEPRAIEELSRVIEPDKFAAGPNVIVLGTEKVSPKDLDAFQTLNRQLAAIQAYKNEHPESLEAIAYVMAAAQGPKGVAQFIVMKAIEGTEYAQFVSDNLDKAQAYVGRKIANAIEREELKPEFEDDKYLIGGGELISSIVIGAIPGKSGKGSSHVAATEKATGGKSKGGDHPSDGPSPNLEGGAHRDTSQPVNDKLDSHHCPAKNCYKGAPISSEDGPAIKMDPSDHRKTASNGSSDEAIAYRARQEKLLGEGKLMDAIQMDVDDIRSKFGDKYDVGIKQMLEYASKLNPNDFRK